MAFFSYGDHKHNDLQDTGSSSPSSPSSFSDDDSDGSLSCRSSASSTVTHVQTLASHKSRGSVAPEQKASSVKTDTDILESFDTRWTDDKHSTYLSYMEAAFVRNLYDREYCSLDLCGQIPHNPEIDETDSAESELRTPFSNTQHKSLRNGGWSSRLIGKPSTPASAPWALLANPWVKHFRPSTYYSSSPNRSNHLPSHPKVNECKEAKPVEDLRNLEAAAESGSPEQCIQRTDGYEMAHTNVLNGRKRCQQVVLEKRTAQRKKMTGGQYRHESVHSGV